MDILLTNTNNINNILEPIKIKQIKQIRKPIKNIKSQIPTNINKEPIIKKTRDNICCTL